MDPPGFLICLPATNPQHQNISKFRPQDEGHNSSASHPGYGLSCLRAQVPHASRYRRCCVDSCRARRTSLEFTFCLAYCVLFGGHKSHKGMIYSILVLPVADEGQAKHDVKATLTMQATGNSGGEGARTHIQGMHHVQLKHYHADQYSSRKFRRCLDPLPPPCIPTTPTRARSRA